MVTVHAEDDMALVDHEQRRPQWRGRCDVYRRGGIGFD
ncbi:hypothetical protein I551_2005 [Mycobacterium ulcerans str. Harvey]|uniref:Uncharacterized protein n=1 Tax=Mycobacterium ulcerans str. Harvey TaxID=1299332 RepID=A0ABN0R399_MYCUL|nr:hypothetical protein I551_2005 [Mycobacterium ulcerans str. Harvey]